MPTPKKEVLPLTIIILTHKVDEKLVNAITSAQFADQVLLVDQGNKVATTKIPSTLQFDKVIIPEPVNQNFNFADLRNQSLSFAKHDWVFFLDSDEMIPVESLPEFKRIINDPSIYGASVNRIDIFYGQQMKWGEVRNQRMIRMGKKKMFTFLRPVHEVGEPFGYAVPANITLMHYSHDTVSSFLDKVAFYAKIDAYHRDEFHQSFEISDLLLYPFGKFILNYFVKLGFLDGWRGLVYAVLMSLHSFFVRVYLYQIQQSKQTT